MNPDQPAENVVEIGHDPHGEQLWFKCPGCKKHHRVPVSRGCQLPGRWEWNGSVVKPTCAPSLLCRWTEGEARTPAVCHFFIRDGRLEFCGDCTHELKGRTVAMDPANQGWPT